MKILFKLFEQPMHDKNDTRSAYFALPSTPGGKVNKRWFRGVTFTDLVNINACGCKHR